MTALDFAVPTLLIVASVPLVLRMVPRNRFYGFRTARTRSSDSVWYPANHIAGVAFLIAGVIWLGAFLVVPLFADTLPQARTYIAMVGVGLLAVAAVVSAVFVRRL